MSASAAYLANWVSIEQNGPQKFEIRKLNEWNLGLFAWCTKAY
eukprot:SAG11_NODE_12245_length_713_cov_1.472313_1_plen_43_part_10